MFKILKMFKVAEILWQDDQDMQDPQELQEMQDIEDPQDPLGVGRS